MSFRSLFLGALLLCGAVSAGTGDVRMWRTRQGERIEGRFVRVLLGKVMLETADGKKQYIALKELSERDAKHLASVFVPEMSIRFSDSSRAKFRSAKRAAG